MYNSYPIDNIKIVFNNNICPCTYTLNHIIQQISPMRNPTIITNAQFNNYHQCTIQQLSPMHNSTIINNYHQCTIQQLSPMHNSTIITNVQFNNYHQSFNACNVLDSSRCMWYQITSRSSPSMH